MEGWDKVVPQFLREMLSSLDPKARDAVEELRLREGFPLAVVQAGEEWTHPAWRGRPLTEEALRRVLETAGRGSVHTVLDQLRSGYVTAAGGVRVGICGEGATREGELLSFRRITSLALRVPHALPGVARPLLPQLAEGGELSNTLILSPPGLGKTTLLRDLIRCVSLGEGVRPRRVGVADERGAGRGRPPPPAGPPDRRAGELPQGRGPADAPAGMAPQVLAVDEITAPEDLRAIQEAAGCGVTLLATAHGGSWEELRLRPLYRELLDQGIFRTFVVLSLAQGKRVYTVRKEGMP
ncbi:MAG: stage III sporulation protein AB [Evtepia gabavorous]